MHFPYLLGVLRFKFPDTRPQVKHEITIHSIIIISGVLNKGNQNDSCNIKSHTLGRKVLFWLKVTWHHQYIDNWPHTYICGCGPIQCSLNQNMFAKQPFFCWQMINMNLWDYPPPPTMGVVTMQSARHIACAILLLCPLALSRHDDDFAFDNSDEFQVSMYWARLTGVIYNVGMNEVTDETLFLTDLNIGYFT